MITQNINSNGSLITWQFTVRRTDNGPTPIPYTVVLQEPSGVAFESFTSSKPGVTYIPGLINLGPTVGLESIVCTVTYRVTDVSMAVLDVLDSKYYFNFRGDVYGNDTILTNNTTAPTDRTEVIHSTPVGLIVDQDINCCEIDASLGGTPCTSCTSSYSIVLGSEVNGTAISINSLTGKIQWRRSNPVLVGSVQVVLTCINCLFGPDVQVSGPKTITIEPSFDNYVTGPQGDQGVQGSQGFQGLQGLQGAQGSQGVQGAQGLQGSQGIQGSQGSQGTTGVQGSQGVQGAVGTQGAVGAQGNQGSTGVTGAQGATGTQGDTGASVAIDGSYANFGALPGAPGGNPTYIAIDTRIVWHWNGASYDNWGTLVGLTGAQGAIGAQGFQGRQGFQGYQGAQGVQGAQGSTGSQGNQGFQGLKGAQGFQGYQGAQGVQGSQGLTGAQGLQGLQGVQGSQGATGAQGLQGFTGVQGLQGAQGTTGAQGATGTQGFQGVAGTGAQGSQGSQGSQGTAGAAGTQGFQGNHGDYSTVQAINPQTADYTLVLLDAGKLIKITSAIGVTLSIPTNATAAIPIGTKIDVVQYGAGQVTIAGVVGVTVNGYPGNKIIGQYGTAYLEKIATDEWFIGGGNLTI